VHLDEHVVAADVGDRLVFEPKAGLWLFFEEGAHWLREQAAEGFRSKPSDLAPLILACSVATL
jgi:hypothetical protein